MSHTESLHYHRGHHSSVFLRVENGLFSVSLLLFVRYIVYVCVLALAGHILEGMVAVISGACCYLFFFHLYLLVSNKHHTTNIENNRFCYSGNTSTS